MQRATEAERRRAAATGPGGGWTRWLASAGSAAIAVAVLGLSGPVRATTDGAPVGPITVARACTPEAEGAVCDDAGDACNGAFVCRSSACVNDAGVTRVELHPLTVSSGCRARDIANNDYAARFFTHQSDPDHTACDYGRAAITVGFERAGSFLQGSLDARGLEPNFAYQIKLVGMPTAEYGASGDDAANQRIGYAGRWYRVGVGNATDAQVAACDADPLCTDVFEGYLLFDFFVTDEFGNAIHRFVADDSFHVLWRDCPPGLSLTGCQAPGGRPTVNREVVALDSTGYGYDQDYPTWFVGVFGEIERTAPRSYLPQGEYRCRFILTEESFHESGVPGAIGPR